MKHFQNFKLLLLSLLLTISAWAQNGLQLGRATFSSAPAKPLLRTEKIVNVVNKISFLRAVGGVAFDSEAYPAPGLSVNNMELKYNSRAADGDRLSIIINGQTVKTKIYDWELVPIAKHANSKHYSCFTLFGELQDNNAVTERNTRVLNYSPEFFNTLLGLRLFQLDILIVHPEISIYLPKKDNKYILGPGESEPDIIANEKGWQEFETERMEQSDYYASYVICDENRKIQFSIVDNYLNLSSTPYYHFWRHNYQNGSDGKILESKSKQISNEIEQQLYQQTNPQRWYENEIIKIDSSYATAVYQLRQEGLGDADHTQELHNVLVQVKLDKEANPVFVSSLSNNLSNKPELFRNINPAVWDAGVKTMRYGAFFRYCKENFPAQWKIFMAQIKRVLVYPVAKTPTLLHLPKTLSISDLLRN
ncbi:MAG: hypothetical protein V4685_03585 [Bacteroidota bacterium]